MRELGRESRWFYYNSVRNIVVGTGGNGKNEPGWRKYRILVCKMLNDLRGLHFGLYLRIIRVKGLYGINWFRILNLQQNYCFSTRTA